MFFCCLFLSTSLFIRIFEFLSSNLCAHTDTMHAYRTTEQSINHTRSANSPSPIIFLCYAKASCYSYFYYVFIQAPSSVFAFRFLCGKDVLPLICLASFSFKHAHTLSNFTVINACLEKVNLSRFFVIISLHNQLTVRNLFSQFYW